MQMIFAQTFIPAWQEKQLTNGDRKCSRAHRMSYSEMMTLLTINRVIGPSSGFNNSTFVSTGYPRFPVC